MLSARLVRLIEHNWNAIVARVLRTIRHDPEFSLLRRLSEAELREWGRDIPENLHHWLIDAREEEVAARYEAQGRLRFEEEVPLHECVRAGCVLKEKILEFVQEQAQDKNFINLYAEEELEHRLGRFFDLTTCHLVRGYEVAMRRACRMAAVV